MEKVCKESVVKASPIPLFNFGKQPKTANACKRLLEISNFKRDRKKGNLFLSFRPALFMDKVMKNKKGLELVTSVFELQNMFQTIHT